MKGQAFRGGANVRRNAVLVGLLLGLAATGQALSAVAPLDAFPATPQLTGTTGNMSGTFTVSGGSNRLLAVAVQCYDSGGSSGQTFSATYGGQPLTPATVENSNRRQTWIGYLNEAGIAAAANATLSVTISGTHTGVSAYVASYSGVDQTTPITATGGRYIDNTNNVAINGSALAVNAGGYGLYNWSGTNTVTRSSDSEIYTEHADVASGGVRTGVASKAFATGTTTNPVVTWSGNIRASVSFVTLNPVSCTVPTITTQPASSTICSGASTTLTVVASGAGTLSYQWYEGTAPSTTTPVGTSSSSYTTPALTATTSYWVRVSNACGPVNSGTATISMDTSRPAAPTGATCSGASSSQIDLSWTNPGASFAGALVVRGPAGGAAPAFVPVDGTTYAAGPQGVDTIVAVGNVSSVSDTGLAAGTTYAYRIYVYGTCRNYSTALATSCATIASPNVTTQPSTATVSSCTQITVSAPFTGDSNNDSSTTVDRGASSTGPWTAVCAGLTGASPRTCTVSGLANATSYYLRVTFAETPPDTVQGTNPEVIGPFTTQDCRVTPGTPVASASSCSTVNVAAPFTGDSDVDSTTTFSRGASATGPWTSVCSGVTGASPRACADMGRTALTTYWYQVTFADPDGVSGTNPQVTAPMTTPACATNDTTIGTVTATNSNCGTAAAPSPGAVTAVATFTGDADQDGTTVFQYGTSSGGPWTSACTTSGPSPRQCTITGLLSGVTYWVRASFTDADGVTGTNPTASVSTGASLPTCGADTVAPTITLLVPSKNAVLSGGDTVKVQVWDAVGLAAANPVRGQVDGTAAAGFTLDFAANGSYSCGSGCTVFQLALAAQAAGTHYLAVRATDAAGNVAVVTIPFRSVAAGTGSGMLLRRTAGSQLCIDCHNLQTHSSQSTSTAYGNWSNDCATCHTPHETTNIYLVRPKLDTPRSGRKDVDFRNTTGRADYSYATVTTPGNGACEVCHTRTKDPSTSLARYRNSGEGGNGHYDTAGTTTRCTSCHPHSGGFKAGESEGEATCSGCHSTIWNGMTGGVAKTTKHTLGNVKGTNDAFGDTNATWGNPLSGVLPADRSCVNTCHDDHIHNVTDPVAPDTTASHNSLGYRDSSTQASRAATTRTTATKSKTDFDAAATNGGMCISCHRNPVDATHPAVPKTEYAASAHNATSTTPGGAWQHTQHDDTAFARNCTKCHWDRNDGLTPTVKKTGIGGVHSSDYPSLLAGSTNPNGAPATFVCYNCHGNGTTGTDYSGKNIATQASKTRNHPSNSDAVHESVLEFSSAAYGNALGGKARHASCLDCHEPHRTKAGTHATPGNAAGPSLEGAWGTQLSSNPAFWTNTASGNFTKKVITAGIDLEATLCFKCHSSYYGTLPTSPSGGFTETDTAKEFNPNNVGNFATTGTSNWQTGETAGGFHPVLATAGSNLGAISLTTLVTTSFPWSTTARNLMTCTDCHESDTTTDPNGPHGSTASFLLRGPNTTWNGTVTTTSTGMPAGTFCANCHNANMQNSRFASNQHYNRSDHRVACWNCHAAIPHGGPRPGMLVASAGASTNVGGVIAGWDQAAPYWGLGTSNNKLYLNSYPASNTANWARSNCGCNGTGH